MGDKDFFKDALKEKNALFYYEKVNLKPGKPVTLAQLNQSIIVGLPGNPLSCLLVLRVLILPLRTNAFNFRQLFKPPIHSLQRQPL